MSYKFLTLSNICLIGLVLWLALKPEPVPLQHFDAAQVDQLSVADIEQLRQRISLLEKDLGDDIVARIDLEQRLQNFEQLSPQQSSSETERVQLSSEASINQPDTQPAVAEQASVEERLIAVGMPTDTIQAMKLTVDHNQLEMLQLRDRAIREGWNDSVEFREQMREFGNPYRALRDEFGDQAFDQYLYATETPNRVEIQEVYSGSAADNAGLKPGDIVVSYASNSIYSMSTLRQSTLEGIAGETILLEINRDGQLINASVPRGPLGISMAPVVVKPD